MSAPDIGGRAPHGWRAEPPSRLEQGGEEAEDPNCEGRRESPTGLGAAASGAPAAPGGPACALETGETPDQPRAQGSRSGGRGTIVPLNLNGRILWQEEEVQILRSALQSRENRAMHKKKQAWEDLAQTLVSAGFCARTWEAVRGKCKKEGLLDEPRVRSEEAPEELRTCKYCRKVYATASSRRTHQGHCSQRPTTATLSTHTLRQARPTFTVVVGDHVEALYRDGLWYGAVIAERRDGVRESSESREGGTELEPGVSGADAGVDVVMGGEVENATLRGQEGGEEAAAGAGGGGVGSGCGVTFVVTWDDGGQEDRVKTESQARASRTCNPPPLRASTRRAQLDDHVRIR